MYIKDFNSACISKSSHSRAARSFFLFDFSKRISSFVFLYQEDVLDFFMSTSIPSLPHCIYQSDFLSYTTSSNVFLFINFFLSHLNFQRHLSYHTYAIDYPPHHYCFHLILRLNAQNHLSPTITNSNMLFFAAPRFITCTFSCIRICSVAIVADM